MGKCVVIAAALALSLVSLASAQGGGGMRGGGGFGGGMPGFGGPAFVSKTDTIIKELKIDPAKKAEIEKFFDDTQKQAIPVNKVIDDLRKEVAGLSAANASDAEAVKKLAAAESAMSALEADVLLKLLSMGDEKQRNKAPKVMDMIVGIFRGQNWRMTR